MFSIKGYKDLPLYPFYLPFKLILYVYMIKCKAIMVKLI
jgi:hypothetical protein